ncbi:MAG: hypothetical protein ACPGWR_09325 [Ardenticatenaceae bacterium]
MTADEARQALEHTDKIKFSAGISRRLRAIYKKYPLESGKCDNCSSEIYSLLQKHNYEAQIVRIELTAESFMPWLVTKDGRTVAHGAVGHVFHEIVVVNAKWVGDNKEYLVGGRIFNAITGSQGMSVPEYFALYYDDLFFDRYFLRLRRV